MPAPATPSRPEPQPLPLPTTAIARLTQDPASAAHLNARDAELLDMLARAGLAPQLEPAATAPLTVLAATRPGRARIGG
jgi:hypothetical protein